MPHLLFDLPTALIAVVVSDWLDITSVIRLDTSYCETNDRPKFAHILSSCVFRFPHECRTNTDNLVNWVNLRNSRTDELFINHKSIAKIYETFLASDRASSMKKVRIQSRRVVSSMPANLLNRIAHRCPKLEYLYLATHESGTALGTALSKLFEQCVHLQELCINSDCCVSLDHQSLFGKRNLCLHTLTLECVYSAEVVAAFLQMAPNLTTLTLTSCHSNLNNGENALQYISSKVIYLAGLKLTDDDLIQIVDKCPRITRIFLSDPKYPDEDLTIRSIEHMAKRLKLTEIDFSYGNISDAGLLAVATHCADALAALDIAHCYGVNIETINAALKLCTKLTCFRCHYNNFTYNLDYTTLLKVTDLHFMFKDNTSAACLSSIAQHCKALVHLTLDKLGRLDSLSDLDSIVNNCTHLCSLTINRNRNYSYGKNCSKAQIAAWRLIRPRLVVTEDIFKGYG